MGETDTKIENPSIEGPKTQEIDSLSRTKLLEYLAIPDRSEKQLRQLIDFAGEQITKNNYEFVSWLDTFNLYFFFTARIKEFSPEEKLLMTDFYFQNLDFLLGKLEGINLGNDSASELLRENEVSTYSISRCALQSIDAILIFGTEDQKKEVINVLSNRESLVNKCLNNKYTFIDMLPYFGYMSFTRDFKYQTQSNQAKDVLKAVIKGTACGEAYKDGIPENVRQACFERLLDRDLKEPIFGFLRVLFDELKSYGLKGDNLFLDWGLGSNEHNFPETVFQNIEQIHKLESSQEGSAQELNSKFGIRNFARYSLQFLINQYENKDNSDIPYGVAIFPLKDSNGAFYSIGGLISNLPEKFKSRYLLRVVECRNKFEITRRLIELNKKCGNGRKNKISFLFICGHGTPEKIRFGNDPKDEVTKEDLDTPATQKIREFYKEKMPIVFISCSTGVEGGIAQKFSKKVETTVIAPNIATSVVNIEPVFNEKGELTDFIVEYCKGEKANEKYVYGERRLDQRRLDKTDKFKLWW